MNINIPHDLDYEEALYAAEGLNHYRKVPVTLSSGGAMVTAYPRPRTEEDRDALEFIHRAAAGFRA